MTTGLIIAYLSGLLLISEDISITQYGLDFPKTGYQDDSEMNPIAKMFTDRNNYVELTIVSVTAYTLGLVVFSSITDDYMLSSFLQCFYLATVSMCELWAISTWREKLLRRDKNGFYFSANIFVFTF